jgi:hypothetical protein
MRLPLVFAFPLACAIFLLGGSARAFAAEYAEAVDVFGEVRLLPENIPLKKGVALREGQRLRTGERAWVIVRFGDKSASQVGPDSEVRLERSNTRAPRLRLEYGGVLSHVKDAAHEVKGKVATAASAGGTFYLREPRSGGPAFFCVCEGKASASWGPHRTEVRASHHEHARLLKPGVAQAEPAPPGTEHNDSDVQALKSALPREWDPERARAIPAPSLPAAQ